jgi:FAD-linked sulfhydryl oxidase
MARKLPSGLIVLAAIAIFLLFVISTRNHERPLPNLQPKFIHDKLEASHLQPETQHGEAIMSNMGNETLKAELGRAAWKLFHTTMARFPDTPTQDESDALKSYIYLFARLYPCGECAKHFQQILKKYPPQTSSRSTAAAWACYVHNEVNISKGKPLFDCGNIGDFYDCGCDDENDDKSSSSGKNETYDAEKQTRREPVEIEKEGPTRGG